MVDSAGVEFDSYSRPVRILVSGECEDFLNHSFHMCHLDCYANTADCLHSFRYKNFTSCRGLWDIFLDRNPGKQCSRDELLVG